MWTMAWMIPFIGTRKLSDKAQALIEEYARVEVDWMISQVSRSGWGGMNSSDGNTILWNIDYSRSSKWPGIDGLYLVVTKERITVAEVVRGIDGVQLVLMPGVLEAFPARTIGSKYPESSWIRIPLPRNPPYRVDMRNDNTPVVSKMIR